MDLPRVFTIRESSHRIHNPFTSGKLGALAGTAPAPGTRVLELASGSGENTLHVARDTTSPELGGHQHWRSPSKPASVPLNSASPIRSTSCTPMPQVS